MGIETWPKLLFTYGPFAILVLLIFVTERKSRLALKEASPDEKRTLVVVYLLNWVAIFALVGFSSYVWFRVNVDQEITIRGKIENLTGIEAVTSTAKMYVRSIYLAPGRADYEWRLIGDNRWPEGERINFTFNPDSCSKTNDSAISDFTLTVKPDYYGHDVLIVYKPAENKMVVQYDNKEEELPRSTRLIAPLKTAAAGPVWPELLPVAHAQTAFPADGFAKSLESPDVAIRRAARADLATRGAAALPWIEQVLADPASSYRLRLGVIVALDNMPSLNASSLRPETAEAIRKAAADTDEAMRDEAASLLSKYGAALAKSAQSANAPVVVFEDIDFNGRSQAFQPGKYRADKEQFGNLRNDSASSLRVAQGYFAQLCEDVINGAGGGHCQVFGPGSYQFKGTKYGALSDRVSYIYVYNVEAMRNRITALGRR